MTISIGYNKKLLNLAKIHTEKIKYSGRNNSFIFKLAIFYDICLKADVSSNTNMKVFFTMLKGLALYYYYSNISTNIIALKFDQICNFIRNYLKRV